MVLKIIMVALGLGIGMIVLSSVGIAINKVKGKSKAELMAFDSYKKMISASLGRELTELDYIAMITVNEGLVKERELRRYKNET